MWYNGRVCTVVVVLLQCLNFVQAFRLGDVSRHLIVASPALLRLGISDLVMRCSKSAVQYD